MTLRSLYVDFNSYFASVEQEENPALRGRPVGVVPVEAETTCFIAASYEAKKFGVRTGTRVAKGRVLCPGIRIIPARPAIYVQYHRRLVEAVESCIPVERVLSIDEMYCELTGSSQHRERALAIAALIKKTVAQRVGVHLRSSIGIAPNVYLAKTATDMQKPDGCVVIDDADLPGCLYRLNLTDLCGVGAAMESRLNRLGIRSVKELCEAERGVLKKAWGGIEGERMYERIRGKTHHPAPASQKSTLGHSHMLPPELRSGEGASAALYKLIQKAAARLRSYGLLAGRLSIALKDVNGGVWEDEIRFEPTADTLEFLTALKSAMAKRPRTKIAPLKVSVTLSNLGEAKNRQLLLFSDCRNRENLNAAIDSINLRYGANTVYFGGASLGLNAAPMRIAFNHIPDLSIEGDD
ncbi:MAG: Y-family DNA polymerase [Deltaproteobacteria bacterium]